jgi:uncharacterized protein YkwD
MADRRGRRFAGLVLLAGVVLVAAAPDVGVPPQSDGVARLESTIAARINAIRQEHERLPLRSDPTLAALARAHSRDMSRRHFFAHEDPGGHSVAVRLKAAGLGYHAVGENIARARNAPDPVEAAVEGWLASEGHRANILREGFTETGVGVWREGDTYYVTQVFRRP